MDMHRFAIDTVTLAGPLEDKLAATRDAGFGGIEIWAKDLVSHPGGVSGAVAAIRASGLRVTSFQLLRDYEGLEVHDGGDLSVNGSGGPFRAARSAGRLFRRGVEVEEAT